MKAKTYQGKVVKKVFGHGSKSQHDAVTLVTENDGELKLRRLGANPFVDPQLEELVGTEIRCTGRAQGSALIIDTWEAAVGETEKPSGEAKSASAKHSLAKQATGPKRSVSKRATKKREPGT